MRLLVGFLVFAALLGGGCDASPPDAQSPMFRPPGPATPRQYRGGNFSVLPIPAGLPDEGIDPRDADSRSPRDTWVIGTGTIDRVLRDDTKRPRHQRFVVRIGESRTLLFAHNIDVAPRVPIKRGDAIVFRGKYIWNAQGGVVHWTHRDKRDRHAGGWIVWKGQNFR